MDWVQSAYDEVWGNDFEKDNITKDLDKTPISDLKRIIHGNLKIINDYPSSTIDWAKYKYNLIKYNTKWGIEIFTWVRPGGILQCAPYVGLDINWNLIKDHNLIRRILFIIHLALEDAWFGPDLISIWPLIDKK